MDTLQEGAAAGAVVRADGTVDPDATALALLEGLLNAMMDEQASELGAARNGYRERSLDTCLGRLTLRIPKLREGTYFPDDIVERWSRTDTALASTVCEMWARGVSTRKVEAVAAEMGVERMGRSRVSRLCEGLVRALSEVMLGASWQRCVAHLERNVSDLCRRRGDGAAAVAALRVALGESDPALVRAGYRRARDLLAAVDPAGAALLEEAEPAALAYLDFPREHRNWVRTNNVQERVNAEIKRRTRVVQVFPSVESLVRLVGAVCCDQNDAWEAAANFIDRRSLARGYEPDPRPGATEDDVTRVLRLVEEAFDRKRRAA